MNRNRLLVLAICAIMCIALFPCHARADGSAPPELISDSAVLIDAATGQVLFSKNMDKQQFPASITKIITVALGLENASLSDSITMSEQAVSSVGRDTSHIALTGGEVITMEHAVYAAMLMSANDACNGIAEHVSGTIPAFAALMTQKAAEWGAKNTNFNNANGLKDEAHYTTAYDMAMIMRHALSVPHFREIIGTKTYEMPPNNKQRETRYFANQHSMLNDPKFHYDGIIGGKAGYTTVAQYTLVTAAERNGITLIAVVMKSPKLNDKYYDTIALLDYGFENFSSFEIAASELSQQNAELMSPSGSAGKFDLTMPDPVRFLLHSSVDVTDVQRNITANDDFSKISLNLSLPDSVTAMHTDLGSFEYDVAAIPAVSDDSENHGSSVSSVLLTILKVLGVIVLVPICGFILLVIVIIIRKRIYRYKRRKRRRAQYENKYNRY